MSKKKNNWRKHIRRDIIGFIILVLILFLFYIFDRAEPQFNKKEQQKEAIIKINSDIPIDNNIKSSVISQKNKTDFCEHSCIVRTHYFDNGTKKYICVPLKEIGACEEIDE